jgi:hypothetical protein
MEAIAIIFGFGGVVVGAVLSYFFTKSHYEQKRRDDLADKELERHLRLRDKTLEEVESYIDVLMEMSRKLFSYQLGMITGELEYSKAVAEEIATLRRMIPKKIINIDLLDDEEVSKLHDQVIGIVEDSDGYRIELKRMIEEEKPLDKAALLDRAFEFHGRVAELTGRIQRRLYSIAKQTPSK